MYLYFKKMQGSTLYAKYSKVNIGALINSQNEIDFIKTWLKENLFFKSGL